MGGSFGKAAEAFIEHLVGEPDDDGIQSCQRCGRVLANRATMNPSLIASGLALFFVPGPVYERRGVQTVFKPDDPSISCVRN